MEYSKHRIAVIGAGGWGKNLIRNLHDLGVLATVCDLDEKTLHTRTAEYPDITFTNAYEAITFAAGVA